MTAPPRSSQQTPKDELNLVYVALTRAMLGLVCNRDLTRLVTAGTAQKYMAVEVGPPAAEDEQDEDQQQRLVACSHCHFQFDASAALASRVGRLAVETRSQEHEGVPGAQQMWCNACVRNTLLGQLVV